MFSLRTLSKIGIVCLGFYVLVSILIGRYAEAGNGYTFDAQSIGTFQWNTPDGLPYEQSYGGNFGFTAFEILDEYRIAFLCDRDAQIKIFDIHSQRLLQQVKIDFFPQDFTYQQGKFYILDSGAVIVMDEQGQILQSYPYDPSIKTVERLKVINDNIYILASEGSTYVIGQNGMPIPFPLLRYDGWLLEQGLFGKTVKNDRNQFTLELLDGQTLLHRHTFTTEQSLGAVRIIGSDLHFMYLDVESVLQEAPLKVSREMWAIDYTDGSLDTIAAMLTLPPIYYIYMKRDLIITSDKIYHVLTTPENVSLFSLKCVQEMITRERSLPYGSFNYEYHYNNHILSTEPIEREQADEVTSRFERKAAITRSQIIANAQPYESHTWTANSSNIIPESPAFYCSGDSLQRVITPEWVTVGSKTKMPYMWGGFSSPTLFNQGVSDGKSAGDRACSYYDNEGIKHYYTTASSCVVGVDCSGFISRAWGLTSKKGSVQLTEISTELTSFSQLKPGDMIYTSGHVRLIYSNDGTGTLTVLEASGADWSVSYHTYTYPNLTDYTPWKYNDVIEDNGTTVCGNVGGQIWTTVGSPYKFTCDVTVQTNTTLTIRPGVTLNYNGWSFTVNGELIWGP